jgi:hypothetical protein
MLVAQLPNLTPTKHINYTLCFTDVKYFSKDDHDGSKYFGVMTYSL